NEDRTRFEVASSNQPEPAMETQPVRQAAPRPAANNSSSASDQQRREEIRQRLEQLRQRLQNNN
ncbi:MAG: type II secretion system protein N, partial [Marinobacter vinifirmus]